VQIIKLEPIKTRKETFKLTFDTGDNLILAADIIVKFGLNSGIEISEETYKEAAAADKAYRAVFEALTLAGRRSYSEKSLYKKLLQKGHGDEDSKAAIKRLKELEYIDDEKYALESARRLSDKGKAEFAVRKELEENGISKDLINKALSSLKTQEEESERIIKIIKTKFKNFNVKDSGDLRRAANYFLRRGFSSEDISKAFRMFGGS
jgi:regulatory protein